MAGKSIILTKHAAERLLERHIPIKTIEKMLKKAVRIADKESDAILCIYKESQHKYYTLVISEEADQITIITAYESGKWQIDQYQKVKKDEHSKMR